MDHEDLKAQIVEAAQSWLDAKRAYEASARVTTRPSDYSELKGNVRRAERQLRAAVEALERTSERIEAHEIG